MSQLAVHKDSRLLEFLIASLPTYKKTKLKQFLKYGSVSVNGVVRTAFDFALHPKDKVELLDRQTAVRSRLKEGLSFSVVFEDEWLIVVNKPAGLLTMASDKEKTDTLYFELTDYIKHQDQKGKGRVFIVHRLDREASGLLVFAKRETVKTALQKNWTDVVKKYYAVVEGTPAKKIDLLESYLVEDKFRRVYSAGQGTRDAKRASTRYQVVQSNGTYSLLDVTLITGRKNQIRVQLADSGHPIVGDEKYGASSDAIGRLALHAYLLGFKHPETGELKTFKINPPDSFLKLAASS